MSHRCAWVLVALASLPFAAPHAAVIDIVWNAAGRMERELQVPPGKFAELCGPLAAGARVSWRFDASAKLDFNIHYHSGRDGKDIVFPARHDAIARAEGRLDVPTEQGYCWMWTNKGPVPATLRVLLQR